MDVIQQALERIEEEIGHNAVDAWKGGLIGMEEFEAMLRNNLPVDPSLEESKELYDKR